MWSKQENWIELKTASEEQAEEIERVQQAMFEDSMEQDQDNDPMEQEQFVDQIKPDIHTQKKPSKIVRKLDTELFC